MESLFFLIPVSLIFLAVAIALFFWAVNSGQYDDVDREGERILFDEDSSSENDDGESAEEERND